MNDHRRVLALAGATVLAAAAAPGVASAVPAVAADAVAAPAAAAPAVASAAPVAASAPTIGGGTTTLALGGLRGALGTPVTVAALGVARRQAGRVSLPLAGGTLSARGRVESRFGAGIALRAGSRSVRLTALRLTLGGAPRLSARVDGGPRVPLFALSRSPLAPAKAAAAPARARAAVAPARARAAVAPSRVAAPSRAAAATTTTAATRISALRLTPAGGRVLRAKLRLRRLPRGTVGTLRLQVRLAAPAPAATPPAAAPPAAPAPSNPAPVPANPAPATPAPTTPAPAPDPVTPPPVFPTPDPGAVLIPGLASSAVVAGAAAWTFRGSWLRYLAAGGGYVTTADGATKDADGAFVYPVSGGGYDSSAGWNVAHGGTVAFVYPNHGIEIVLAQPRIELGSRAVIEVLLTDSSEAGPGAPGGGSGGGDGTARRIDFATLDLASVTPTRDGATVTWTNVPVLLTAAGAKPFLAYRDGEPFGRITIRATVAGG